LASIIEVGLKMTNKTDMPDEIWAMHMDDNMNHGTWNCDNFKKHPSQPTPVKYIRADIVDELVRGARIKDKAESQRKTALPYHEHLNKKPWLKKGDKA
jgi:hypothetical protein